MMGKVFARRAAVAGAIALAAGLAGVVRADVVVMTNGDRLNGKIMRVTPEAILLSAYGTQITLPREQVARARSDQPVPIVGAGNRVTTAYVVPGEKSQAFAAASQPATTEAAATQVATTQPPAPLPAGVAPIVAAAPGAHAQAVKPKEHKQLDLEPYFLPVGPHWKDTLALGAISTAGNTDSTNLTGSLDLEYDHEPWTLSIKLGGVYGSSNGEQTDALAYNDNILKRTLPEWHTKRLYFFGENHNTYDGIKGISLRSTTAAGVGYYLFQGKRFKMDVRVGPGYQYEKHFSGAVSSDVVGLAGVHAEYVFSERVNLTQDVHYTTALDDYINYQITSETALNIKLPEVQRGMGVKFGFRDDYDNTAMTDQRNDTRLTAALTLDF